MGWFRAVDDSIGRANGAQTVDPEWETPMSSTESGPLAVSSHDAGDVDGVPSRQWTLANGAGMSVDILEFGGIISTLSVPDRDAIAANVVLGFETLSEYVKSRAFFGCITGRYANRIARGRFTLDGKEYQLALNNPPNALHGGKRGFDRYVWAAEEFRDETGVGVHLQRSSPDGEEGYPGTI